MALGWPSVEWGLAHISALELSEWMAYERLEPFGEWRGDVRAGIVAATIANVNRDAKKRSKPFTAEDFMPTFGGEERKTQTWEEQLQMARMLAGRIGTLKSET